MKIYPITIPGGSDTCIQYNNGGIFGGDSSFVFDSDGNTRFTLSTVHSAAAANQITAAISIEQDTATANSVIGAQLGAVSTHTSGTVATMIGTQFISQAQSNGAVTYLYGVFGSASALDTYTPNITVLNGVNASVVAMDAAVTYGFSAWIVAPTKDAGTITDAISGYFEGPTAGGTQNLAILSQGDVMLATGKKLFLEGALGATGDTYIVYDGVSTMDFFVNNTEIMNASTTVVNIPVELDIDGNLNHDGSNVGFFGTAPAAQQAHIIDADGTLADITTKFNTLLSDLEGYGLLASA